ncbi:unnamed protein product [Vitrella brassicaformis CCMP3155]|uniref:Protein kinase domain-containing protein n=2 Tax=Vitrella brassicaformis TaxID=1169539 RepID=A0A0G4GX03_VITBC|nr:unnamed protein product [Vitrella brassicaformis CCMP3155]|mmetsp:Transcript_4347/g.9945  ORF Transcript_4347/g.9945 Transcript_4347/m.9945 type:complete len:394 (+) Transcript_4347:148-1329(+)|eukprot:CEM35580.1 unnamed protein product [Vitrella brassicaformis CCMP3155]
MSRGSLFQRAPIPEAKFQKTEDVTKERDADGKKRINQYVVGELLGQGTFGRVKLCHDTVTGNRYAMKVFRKQQLMRKKDFQNEGPGRGMSVTTALSKVYNEIEMMESYSCHPRCVNLVEVLEHQDSQKIYVVMTLGEVGSLLTYDECEGTYTAPVPGEWIPASSQSTQCSSRSSTSRGRSLAIPEPIAKCFIKDALEGIAHLHEHGIVHRDIKPDNFFITTQGRVLLGDFTVASKVDEHGRVRGTEGTYSFMPPECCTPTDESQEYSGHDGRAADMWALGVTVWVVLFGSLPFQKANLKELFESIAECQYRIPPDAPVSPEGLHFIQAVLVKDATNRLTAKDALAHPWVSTADFSQLPAYIEAALKVKEERAKKAAEDASVSGSSSFTGILRP